MRAFFDLIDSTPAVKFWLFVALVAALMAWLDHRAQRRAARRPPPRQSYDYTRDDFQLF